MQDIQNRKDIESLIDAFYTKVLVDGDIGHIFTDTIDFIWEKHIPTMYSFWESILFQTNTYKGNPVSKHIELNNKTKLSEQHFDTWIALWNQTIDENFKGQIAEMAKEKAAMMKLLMLHKINESSNPNFIQ